MRGTGVVGGGLVLGIRWPRGGAQAALTDVDLGTWIRVGTDGSITIWVEKAEMGQGIHTSLAVLVAEELEVGLDQIRVEPRPLKGPHRKIVTGGSSSVRSGYEQLRLAGAVAREMLAEAAAQAWSVARSECRAERAAVHHPASGRSLAYAELAAAAATQPVPKLSREDLKPLPECRLIGQPVPRLDLPAKVDGSARFGIDVRLEGMLYGAPVMSPAFGGEVRGADRAAALAKPGVRAVVDIPGGLVVVADRYWKARSALAVLKPIFEKGAPECSSQAYSKKMREALETPGIPQHESGDVAAAFEGAAGVVEASYEVPFLAHASMEPMNCTAHVRERGCEVWAPTQSSSRVREAVAAALRVDIESICVHTTLMGGSFGRRAESDFAVQAALASRAVGRPVQIIWSREDDIRHDFYRPACAARLRAAVDANGLPLAYVHHVAGPWPGLREWPGWLRERIGRLEKALGRGLIPGITPDFIEYRFPKLMRSGVAGIVVGGETPPLLYRVASQRSEYSLADTGVPLGWWRSVAASQNGFFAESFMDELAHAAGRDPYEYRRAQLEPRARRVLELAASRAGWGERLPSGRGRGIAIYHSFGTTVCHVVDVTVGDRVAPRVDRVVCAVDCGTVVNPDTVEAQMESSIVFGLTAALKGEITLREGAVVQSNFHDYRLMGFGEIPEIEVHTVASSGYPGGIGEPGTPPIAPALVNALFSATGERIRVLPVEGFLATRG